MEKKFYTREDIFNKMLVNSFFGHPPLPEYFKFFDPQVVESIQKEGSKIVRELTEKLNELK